MAKVNENSRRYLFPNDEEIVIDNVRDIQVSSSGGHRLTTKEGGMVYIPFKWLAIDIDSDKGWEY